MTEPTTGAPAAPAPAPAEGAFTQEDVDRIVGERIARERAKFADYDDLKAAAGKAADLQAQYEDLLGKHSAAEHELRIERAARRHGLDDDLVPFLGGETDEEVEERAKTLAAKLAAAEPPPRNGPKPDPSQGHGTAQALNGDPLLDSLKTKLGIT